jgi:hypothetical protein
MAEPTYVITGQNLGSTGKAIKFKIVDINGALFEPEEDIPSIQWFPTSQVIKTSINVEYVDRDIKEWIMMKKELI